MTNFISSIEWKRFFQVVSVITLACILLGSLADDADARKRKKRVAGYTPPYAEMVVDINSGRVLRAVNADAPRFPASITKVMTLYILFEQIEKGRMKLSTPLEVSAFAASQSPSKLGLRPGSTIAVEDAIYALVTKSANDVAVTVAENISGSQDEFAKLMTRKARQLGMSRTTFKNASGLPNREQVTTARDLVRLGVAIKRDFPQYYDYFQTRSFAFRGQVHRNHNRLLGRVDGVDGIKTGYTRASGFNLLTSAREGNRQVMTVVLGGRSGRSRDARVAQLVRNHLGSASNRANPALAARQLAALNAREPGEGAEDGAPTERAASPERVSSVTLSQKKNARPAVVTAEATTPTEVSAAVAYASPKPELVGPAVLRSRKDKKPLALTKAKVASVLETPSVKGTESEVALLISEEPPVLNAPKAKRNGKLKLAAAEAGEPTITNTAESVAKKPTSGWVIQLAAADNEAKALKILDKAKASQSRLLAGARPFTEQVQKGDATLWRARFGGFDGADAQAACSALKKSGFNCLAQRA
jgi:D-alanyl-D-alanine carboxypeptidase